MASATTEYPHQVGGKIRQLSRDQMDEAGRRFGVTDGALVRKALEDYMPRYLNSEVGVHTEIVSIASEIGCDRALAALRKEARKGKAAA